MHELYMTELYIPAAIFLLRIVRVFTDLCSKPLKKLYIVR